MQGLKLGDCVLSRDYPQIAQQIVPTPQQTENAFLLASFFYRTASQAFGKPVIHSWIRSFELNSKIGGSPTSDHLYGCAGDFTFPNSEDNAEYIYNFFLNEVEWPGELFYYRKKGHIHASIPRLGVWIDRGIVDK